MIIRAFFWGLMLSAIMAVSAHAQNNQTITINPDGTVTISDPSGQAPTRTLEKSRPKAPVEPVAPRAPRQAEPIEPVEKPSIAKPVIEEPDVPVARKPAKPEAKAPIAKKSDVPKAPSKPKQTGKESVKEQPPVRESMGRVDPKYKPEPRKPGPVTADEAKRIALDVAPPALSVDVYPANYKGIKVFQVIFKTEEGERFVLVDRQTGAIIGD